VSLSKHLIAFSTLQTDLMQFQLRLAQARQLLKFVLAFVVLCDCRAVFFPFCFYATCGSQPCAALSCTWPGNIYFLLSLIAACGSAACVQSSFRHVSVWDVNPTLAGSVRVDHNIYFLAHLLGTLSLGRVSPSVCSFPLLVLRRLTRVD